MRTFRLPPACGPALAVIVIVAAFVASAGCTNGGRDARPRDPAGPPIACTLIGCEDGLHIALEPRDGWPRGRYRFEIEADGRRAVCTGSLPLPPCGHSGANAVSCDPPDVVQIVESGCALPGDSQSFPGIRFDPKLRPSEVALTVSRDGAVVGQAALRPQFQTLQPNGADCPPVCHAASATVPLRF